MKPRAARSRVLQVRAGALEVAVAAPPVDGAANAELAATLARWLKVPKSAVQVVVGTTARSKLVAIQGVTPDDVRARLES